MSDTEISELNRLRKRVIAQRAELRRLNKIIAPRWAAFSAEHDAATALPYDEKHLHHPDTGTGWKCYVCGYGGAANNYANTFCVNCTDEDG